jgi:uncharacterized RDD family membrane protein YckC
MTPQAPTLPGPLADWGSRLGAWFVDGLIVWVPGIVVVGAFIGGASASDGNAGLVVAAILAAIAFFVYWLIYAPLLMRRPGASNGQTWGKQAFNIRVVRDNGQQLDFGYAALREIVLKKLAVNIASSIIPLIPFILNYFWPLWDDQNRALHDMAVSTHVVKA